MRTKPKIVMLLTACAAAAVPLTFAAAPTTAPAAPDVAAAGPAGRPPTRPATNPAGPDPVRGGELLADRQAKPLPAVAARYEMSVTPVGKPGARPSVWDWYLWREPDRIEVRETRGDTGEVWDRGPDGRIAEYRIVFHKHRRAVTFVPGDMKAAQLQFDWYKLGTVTGLRLRAALRDVGEVDVPAAAAKGRRYEGRVNGVDVELVWLPDQQIPALIRQAHPDRVVAQTLQAVSPDARTGWDRPSSAGYEHTDFADIGDNEKDPFFQQFQRYAPVGGHRH